MEELKDEQDLLGKDVMKMNFNEMDAKQILHWDRELLYRYWLISIPGIGKKTVKQLLSYAETAEEIYGMSEESIGDFLKEAQLRAFLESRDSWNLEQEYKRLLDMGISFYPSEHPIFPERLREIPDVPIGIFVKGSLPDKHKISVAVIGARRCSEYGRFMARQYGEALAHADIQVISGMASGVDGISQKGAIAAGGTTFAVLGCGVDICYPAENRDLYNSIVEHGGIISEYLPGTEPRAGLFPLRNRIISGLADAIVVIEAKEKSGTLITVDMALEQGREVFALPGRTTDVLSRGCNKLLKQGAGITLSPEDLIYELTGEESATKTSAKKQVTFASEIHKQIYQTLDNYPKAIQEIHDRLPDVPLPTVLQVLVEFCMDGKAAQVTNGYYVKCG